MSLTYSRRMIYNQSFFTMNGHKIEWLCAVFICLVATTIIIFIFKPKMSAPVENAIQVLIANPELNFCDYCKLAVESSVDTKTTAGRICEQCIQANKETHPYVEFCSNCFTYTELVNKYCGLCQPEAPLKRVNIRENRNARCMRYIKRGKTLVRCRHVPTYGSVFCFVHKHIEETEQTLKKIKALREEQHVFNATEYEWKTCDECLAFLKKLNIKDPEKYVPRSTCKNCKLFFRMVEHPEFPIIDSPPLQEELKDDIIGLEI